MLLDFSFGVEIEKLLFQRDNEVVCLDQANQLFVLFVENGAEVIEKEGDCIFMVSKKFKDIAVGIKSESVSNIIEYIFPPMFDTELFLETHGRLTQWIRPIFKKLGIRESKLALLPTIPPKIEVRAARSDIKRVTAPWSVPSHPLADTRFWHVSASTHVHFQMSVDEYFARLKNMYCQEWKVVKRFSASKAFLGVEGWCLRPLAYQYNFFEDYLLFGIPRYLPTSQLEYEMMENISENFIRDYSFIALRKSLGTAEFRSCDTLSTAEEVVELIKLRREIWETRPRYGFEEGRKRFFDVCWESRD